MQETVKELRHYLFKQDKQKTIESIISNIEIMSKKLEFLSPKELTEYEICMKDIECLFGRGDYLAVSDVIKYELLPIFQTKEN